MHRPALLAALLLPALASADFGPAPRECPAAGLHDWPDVARRGDRVLVAWREVRPPARAAGGSTRFSVRALDGAAAITVGETRTASAPSLAACPDGFALAWAEPKRIVVTYLDGNGKPKRSESIETGADTLAVDRIPLGCDADGAFVAWTVPGKAQLFGARTGAGAKPKVLFAEDAPGNWLSPAVAAEPSGYRLVWQGTALGDPALLSARVATDLRPRGAVTVVAKARGVQVISIARAASGSFAVVWDSPGAEGPVSAVRLSAEGALLDAAPLALSSGRAWSPAVVAEGDVFTVAWALAKWPSPNLRSDSGTELHGTKLPAHGAPEPYVLHAGDITTDQPRLAPGVAVFTDGVPYPGSGRTSVSLSDVWALASGGSPVLMSKGPGEQRTPAMASRGAQTLLAWVDDCGHPEAIRGAVVSDGKLSGELELGRGISPARNPVVAAGPEGWLLAWVGPGAVWAARVSAAGGLVDSKPLKVGDGAAAVAAAWHGAGWVLAWHANNAVVSVQLPAHGAPPGFSLARVGEDTFGSSRVAVACEPPYCLAGWNTAHQMGSLPVTQRLPKGAPELDARYPQQLDDVGGQNAALAAGSGAFLFAWTSGGPEGANSVLTRRVPVLPGQPGRRVELAGDAKYGPLAVAFDGRRFAVGWRGSDESDPLRWAWEDGRAQSLGVRGDELALSGTAGGGLLAAWVEEHRVRVRELSPHRAEPADASAAPAVAPVRLAELMMLTRAAVAQRSGVDALLKERLGALMKNVQAATARGALPVDFTRLWATGGKDGPVRWSPPTGGNISTGAAGVLSVVDGRFTGKQCRFAAVFGSAVLCDGPVKTGSVSHALIIATGDVTLAHVDSSVVIAGGRIEVSHDGSQLQYGRGVSSVFLSGARIDASFLAGTVLGAADGVRVEHPNSVALLNTPASRPRLEPVLSSGVILDEGRPVEAGLEVALQGRDLPDRAGAWVFKSDEAAFAREGQEALDGWRVAFITDSAVLLRRGGEKVSLAPARPDKPPPLPPRLRVPAEAEIHQVGAYDSSRADSVITVEVDRPVPVVLVLDAYGPVAWDVRATKQTRIIGVLLGGYQAPARLSGIEPGTPVVTRVHAYGEPYFFDYPGSKEPNTGSQALRALTERPLTSFQGAEKLDHAVIK